MCIGGRALSAILRVLCINYHHFAGGMPDLLVFRAMRDGTPLNPTEWMGIEAAEALAVRPVEPDPDLGDYMTPTVSERTEERRRIRAEAEALCKSLSTSKKSHQTLRSFLSLQRPSLVDGDDLPRAIREISPSKPIALVQSTQEALQIPQVPYHPRYRSLLICRSRDALSKQLSSRSKGRTTG